MLFSIVVPIYKVEKYLKKCVESILTQSFTDFELILVDDGSPDNCPNICDDYAKRDARVRVVHKQNGGLVSARKAGLEVAKGEYVVSVDGDDFIKENYLSFVASAIEKYSPDIFCVGYEETDGINSTAIKPYNCDEGFYDREKIEKQIFPILIQNEYGESFMSSHGGKIFKRGLLEYGLYKVDNRISLGEDSVCIKLCVNKSNSLFLSNENLYCYRQNPKSITKSKKAFDWKGPLLRANILIENIDMNQFSFREQLDRSVVHSLFNVVCSQFYRKEKYSEIKKDIKKHLEEPFYKQAIKNCQTKSKKLKLALFALKHKAFWLMKLYSKIR